MPWIVESHDLAAGAEEDRAALSGRPRKANAGQYATVMPQRDFTQRRPRLTPRGAVALLGAAGFIGARRRRARHHLHSTLASASVLTPRPQALTRLGACVR